MKVNLCTQRELFTCEDLLLEFLMLPRVMFIIIITYLLSCFIYIISVQTVTFDMLESHLLLVYVL